MPPVAPPRVPRSSFASTAAVRQRMQSQPRSNTAPELLIRREVHRAGLRYFVGRRPLRELRRTADLVFPTAKVAVFVDGCFWHGCPTHGRVGTVNSWYWPSKVATNVERDRDTDRALVDHGWIPIRIWEHEAPKTAADLIITTVRGRRSDRPRRPADRNQ